MYLPNKWTLDDGVKLIRALQQPSRRYHYHLCLGGGVLNNGLSDKDLDLYFLPMGTEVSDPKGLVKWLDGLWGSHEMFNGHEHYPDEIPYIFKGKWTYDGLRVDVFVMGSEADGKKLEEPKQQENEIKYYQYTAADGHRRQFNYQPTVTYNDVVARYNDMLREDNLQVTQVTPGGGGGGAEIVIDNGGQNWLGRWFTTRTNGERE